MLGLPQVSRKSCNLLDLWLILNQGHRLHVNRPEQLCHTPLRSELPPALEDDEVGVARPHHVGVVWCLLHMGRPQAVLSLVKIPEEGH